MMRIYTYSIISSSFESYVDKVPYAVAIVEDENGARQAAFIENYAPDKPIQIGQEVKLCGRGETGYLICRLVETGC